jgi:signal transduction histidine kinase
VLRDRRRKGSDGRRLASSTGSRPSLTICLHVVSPGLRRWEAAAQGWPSRGLRIPPPPSGSCDRGKNTRITGPTVGTGPQVEPDPYEVACSFVESLDLDQTFWRVAQNTVRALGQGQCLLFEYDHAGNALNAVAASGPDVRAFMGRRISLVQPGQRVGLRGGHVVDLCALMEADEELAGLCALLNSGASITLPLTLRNELVGALAFVAQNRSAPLSLDEVELAAHLAKLAAWAIHNSRQYRYAMRGQGRLEAMLTRMSQVHDRERNAFAAMVHDDILQPMIGAVYALEGLRDVVHDAGIDDYDHVVRMLRMSVEDARKMIWEMRPAVLDGLGLAEALGVIADRIAVERGIKVTTTLQKAEGLAEGLSTAIYKIGREALLNAERHAQASSISIALTASDVESGSVALVVQDDGTGFAGDGERSPGHYGLVMMEEQAAAVGGTLHIVRNPGGGTTVHLIVPTGPPQDAFVEGSRP